MSTLSLPSRIAQSPRSHSAGRPGRGEGGDRTRARSPLPSTPRLPSHPGGNLRPTRDKPDTARTNSSSTTSSTSGSSFLDRMKTSSSRTSLDEKQPEPPRQGGGGGWAYRRKGAVQAEDEQSDEEDLGQVALGHGADLWSRVTAVASKLTVNVGQAWQKSILADGEETPPGEESRLTKAMKAYHLDRARSPADLPPWLFTEHERGVGPNTRNVPNYEDRFLPDRTLELSQQGSLRDVYNRAAASLSIPATRISPAESRDGGGSRAADRLKAIRDAKRSAKTGSEPAQLHSEDRYRDMAMPRSADQRYSSGEESRPRVGLPARPGTRRRQ